MGMFQTSNSESSRGKLCISRLLNKDIKRTHWWIDITKRVVERKEENWKNYLSTKNTDHYDEYAREGKCKENNKRRETKFMDWFWGKSGRREDGNRQNLKWGMQSKFKCKNQ